ncbi:MULTISPECIES: molecular chaperone [Paraburkholderia]|nr:MULTISPECIES: molecular chaperone [Paraburkholderia]MCX4162429.1 molecular chaperone [Paraburkholderia megapolitana]MDN7157924.1 molecular chaperone [Paraburkholderia sp. CHISQ3]MDQ6494971.1 molecular chaperone [Paraburkholderia megapolitana]
MFVCAPFFAHASVEPDRTRVVLNESDTATKITVTNRSSTNPYLVQSWIENEQGEKITSPLIVVPPLQRIEPNESNVLRIARLPGATLPADRETVFYLNIREVPPKVDTPNTLQLALHSQLKLFYRPNGVRPAQDVDPTLPMTLRIDTASHKLVFDNPTPYHITIVELAADAQKTAIPFNPLMASPMSQIETAFSIAMPTTLYVSHIDDYGGQVVVKYACSAGVCKSTEK